jgi:DNA-binding CsgD family transcriptional regulator
MDRPDFEALSARERECLRLVARDRGSGEIATELELAIGTVENHIKNARAKLGGISRFEAARQLAEYEGRSQSLASCSTGIASGPKPGEPAASFPLDRIGSEHATLREDRAIFVAESPRLDPTIDDGAPRNEPRNLNPIRILLMICAAGLAVAALIIAAVPVSDSFQHLANGVDSLMHH